VRNLFAKILNEKGIKVQCDSEIVAVQAQELLCKNGVQVPFDECIWCTEVRSLFVCSLECGACSDRSRSNLYTQGAPQKWLEGIGLQVDEKGFLAVTQRLQVPYAVVAWFCRSLLPKKIPHRLEGLPMEAFLLLETSHQ
jgi:NADH dehydrogenase FAD-containing subunit